MATVTRYIYSHYDPPNHNEDQDTPEQLDEYQRDPWLTEPAFGVKRRLKNVPQFVPAVVSYDEVNNMIGNASSSLPRYEKPAPSSHVGDWYKSLPRACAPAVEAVSPPPSVAPPLSSAISEPLLHARPGQNVDVLPFKNDWFSSNPIISSSRSAPTTLADILSREPPPERTEGSFVPPVFLHLGPSNKGFAMLQQRGWSEGEALGATVPRRMHTQKKSAKSFLDDTRLLVKTEEREVEVGTDDDIREVRRVDVVDLTLSDSDEGPSDVEVDSHGEPSSSAVSHNPKALLTPLATVLKTDRLGIGLKAKTTGPFKESKKRITHNQAALAAHLKASEDMGLRKALFGRGARSFARIAKAETESRKRLLASLNE